jgi:putative DNA methylase
LGEIARDLAYRLYTTSEKKKWSEEARSYNSLVVSWPEIKRLTSQFEGSAPEQKNLF